MNNKVLDCTLRDGGYYTDWHFSAKFLEDYLKTIKSLPINIIEVGYLCEMRMHGTSKTGSSIRQLINRGFPYIIAALKCRMSTNENKRQ